MSTNRRQFLKSTLVASAPLFVPASAFGANERLNIGVIGVAGRGGANLAAMGGENVVALCDADRNRLAAAHKGHPEARTFEDYRQLLDEPDLDAVVISTPDHHHAPATMRALRRGLHVYCEKPLTHTVEEARLVADEAARQKVATQMGTQNHQHPGYLQLVELLETKAIGDIQQAHIITDRPGRWWPQGLTAPGEKQEVPAHLNWDVWLGPAPVRNYHAAYVPFKWRGWWDFGCGAIGDMAIHLMDPTFWGLKLGGTVRVTSEGPPANSESGPTWMITKFEFGQRGDLAPVDVYWYEGTAKPAAEIAAELPMNGSLFIGSKGKIAIAHGGEPRMLPEKQFEGFSPPESYLPTSPGHHQQWIEACKTGNPTGSHFGYAGPFTEIVLLGNLAHRVGQPITYDPGKMKITDNRQANSLLRKEYRKGWGIRS
jgi:predicted dehydrogenase